MLSRKGNCFVHQFPLKKGAYFFLYQGQTFLGHLPSLLLLHTFNKEKPQFHCSAFFELSFIFTALHLVSGCCQQIFQPTWLQPEQVCLEIVSFRKSGAHILCFRVNPLSPQYYTPPTLNAPPGGRRAPNQIRPNKFPHSCNQLQYYLDLTPFLFTLYCLKLPWYSRILRLALRMGLCQATLNPQIPVEVALGTTQGFSIFSLPSQVVQLVIQ